MYLTLLRTSPTVCSRSNDRSVFQSMIYSSRRTSEREGHETRIFLETAEEILFFSKRATGTKFFFLKYHLLLSRAALPQILLNRATAVFDFSRARVSRMNFVPFFSWATWMITSLLYISWIVLPRWILFHFLVSYHKNPLKWAWLVYLSVRGTAIKHNEQLFQPVENLHSVRSVRCVAQELLAHKRHVCEHTYILICKRTDCRSSGIWFGQCVHSPASTHSGASAKLIPDGPHDNLVTVYLLTRAVFTDQRGSW